jgi:hypothetical protein
MKKFVHTSTRYVINGREYHSLEEMPPEDRKFFEDANRNGIPDHLEKFMTAAGAPPVHTQTFETHTSEVRVSAGKNADLDKLAGIIDALPETDAPSRPQLEAPRKPWVIQVNLLSVLTAMVVIGGLALAAWFLVRK